MSSVQRVSVLFPALRRPEKSGWDAARVTGYDLLLRGGFVAPLAAGLMTALPLMTRVVRNIEAIIREEMDLTGAQEVEIPVVQPASILQESGRFDVFGPLLGRFTDRNGRLMALTVTAEEVAARLSKDAIQSYRDLPRIIYQIGRKYRDEPRPRQGLLRGREFTMKDGYSLAATPEQLDAQYAGQYRAYSIIFGRCGLPQVFPVSADPGMMGGKVTHEFMLPATIGEDTLILCDACGYASNQEVAEFRKPPAPSAEPHLPREELPTPGAATIEALGSRHGISPDRTAKAVFFRTNVGKVGGPEAARKVVVMAIVRGDMKVSHTKVANAVKALDEMADATLEDIRAVGAEPGYASPVGLEGPGLLVVVDTLAAASPNLVAGANRAGFHLRNVNHGRDYTADLIADITEAQHGLGCSVCDSPLREQKAVEVGHVFQFGARYSDPAGATFVGEDGERHAILGGSYGIGPTRLAGAIAEVYRDDRGLIWPVTVAPYQVHLLSLGTEAERLGAVRVAAEALVEQLLARGVDVLFDDRGDVSGGEKFSVADLLGMPVRVTVSTRSLAGDAVEVRLRTAADSTLVGFDRAAAEIAGSVERLRRDVAGAVRPLEYRRG